MNLNKLHDLAIEFRNIAEKINIKAVSDYEILKLLKQIGRQGRKHHYLCERYCNESDFNPELIDKLRTKIGEKVTKLNELCYKKYGVDGFIMTSQNDPRGLTIKLTLGDCLIYEVLK